MDKIRVGVIGLGIGRHHIRGFQTHPVAEVVALADLDRNGRRHPLPWRSGGRRGGVHGPGMVHRGRPVLRCIIAG